jgi:hypothetical protein
MGALRLLKGEEEDFNWRECDGQCFRLIGAFANSSGQLIPRYVALPQSAGYLAESYRTNSQPFDLRLLADLS